MLRLFHTADVSETTTNTTVSQTKVILKSSEGYKQEAQKTHADSSPRSLSSNMLVEKLVWAQRIPPGFLGEIKRKADRMAMINLFFLSASVDPPWSFLDVKHSVDTIEDIHLYCTVVYIWYLRSYPESYLPTVLQVQVLHSQAFDNCYSTIWSYISIKL